MSNFDFPSNDTTLEIASNKEEQLYEVQKKGKQKSYICRQPDCGKVFRYHSEIIRHIATHSETRPYICDFEGCKKSFKRKDALENHVRTHTNDKPFACPRPGCDQKFATKASLRYHLLKHDGQREYVCSFPGCGKTFVTISQLKQHENSSTVHKNIKMTYQPENYVSVFPEEPAIEKKIPDFDNAFNAWEPITRPKTEANPAPVPINNASSTVQDPLFNFPMFNQQQQQPQEGKTEEFEKTQKENDYLRKQLEEARKYISILQQRQQADPFAFMEHFNGNEMFGASNMQNFESDLFMGLDQ